MVFRIVATKPVADCALAYIGDYLRRVGTFFVPTRLAEFPRGHKYVPTLRKVMRHDSAIPVAPGHISPAPVFLHQCL